MGFKFNPISGEFDMVNEPSGGPNYHFIKVTNQNSGDLHLFDDITWAVSRAVIKTITIKTTSTDWDLYLIHNSNGYIIDDANIPKLLIMKSGSGDANILLDYPYSDEDSSNKVHLYYNDNSGTNTADIYIMGTELK